MDLQKLNPWNWFKHEESKTSGETLIPVKRPANEHEMPLFDRGFSYPITQLHQEIDRLFEDAYKGLGFPLWGTQLSNSPQYNTSKWLSNVTFRPNINVSGNEKNYQITLETPGLKKSDITIEINGDVLSIHGQKQEETENHDRHFYRVERSYGAFQRTLALPDDANVDDIQASMKDGVLNLTIPRRESKENQIKKITIN